MLARILNLLCHLELFLATQHLQQDPNPHDIEFWNRIAREHVDRKLRANPHLLTVKRPKNVILFIGDGMGISTVTSARINKNQKAGNPYLNEPLFFERFATAGMVKTSSFSHHVTDSAAGAMALLTGRKVDSKTLGMVPKSGTVCAKGRDLHVTDGIVENALHKGLDVGFVTNARITHATPGALYAKGLHRDVEYDGAAKQLGASDCNDIARQLLSYPASEFKVMMGGGADFLIEKSRGGMREDGMNIDLEWSRLGGSRRVLGDVSDLQGVEASSEKLLGIFAGSHLPMYLEEQMTGSKTVPRLSEMAAKAIEQLQHDDKGFFLMVEGGNIDIAEHANQMHLAFAEVYEFEEAIRKAREMTDPSETLIIVTADHGHALTLPGYLPVEKSLFSSDIVTQPTAKEEQKFELPGLFFASGPGFRGGLRMTDVQVNEQERADPLFRQPASVPMAHGAHGGEDVGIWADGPLSDLFSSSLENTEVAYIIKFLLCLSSSDHTFCSASEQKETPQHGFIRGLAESIGPEGLLISGVFLLVVAVLSLLATVFLAGLLFVHNKRSLRDLECSSQATLVKTPM